MLTSGQNEGVTVFGLQSCSVHNLPFCLNMAWNQPYCLEQHAMNSLCFGLSTDMEHNLTGPQQQVSKNFETKLVLPQTPLYPGSASHHNTMMRLHEGDQVVPSFQRLTVLEGHHREVKPLPPPPDPEELMSDEAADSEVEFFTSDRRRLLPKSCPKSPCHGGPSRTGFRGCGQVNYAYQENPSEGSGGGGTGCIAHPWASTEVSIATSGWTSCEKNVAASFGASGWTIGGAESGSHMQQPQREETKQMVTAGGEMSSCVQQPDHLQHPSLRRNYCGTNPHHHHHPWGSCTPSPTDKPEVPPRIPIPPKPSKTVTNPCPLSSNNEDDKPPKIPPRVPLVPMCPPPRTPSPKSLPLYINGVMPPTQSFAPNPKYVRKAPQRRHSERAPPVDQSAPCIVPIMRDGRQASATHYFLLPRRPAYMDRLERLLREPPGEGS